MRFFLSLLIWLVIIGGLFVYTWQRDAGLPQGPPVAAETKHVQGSHVLEITPTFSVEKDPFALQTDTDNTSLLELRLNGTALDVPAADMRRGQVIQIHELQKLQIGFNEFYVSAGPPISESMLAHGMRIRLLNGSHVFFDDTIWANPGARVSGTINFSLAADKDDHHEH
ncbi:hypothetical protein HRM2_34140 [Desulforapulum autotrophicum HRM2]|uniref:Uncharacterized protein n=1 Tax=Desulforapulum autotrophicum (strain ATCC 43914 / DSM 3382 / VKM B-1955 / HRM2) TaxID=177437 RepID=C0QMH2_DESAH|nr:hypothetical protein [Desulforapulum autotrophicum]ACN16489.1 hypothetical protein HRM2_34140 [Desulforapulum autotrophicum HRM2]